MKDTSASVIAFLVAPVIPGVVFALGSPGLGGGMDASLTSILNLTFAGYLITLWIVAILALPTFLVLRQRGLVSLWSSVAAGVAIAAVVAFLLFLPPTTSVLEWFEQVVRALPKMCAVGAATGLVFWAIRSLCLGEPKGVREF